MPKYVAISDNEYPPTSRQRWTASHLEQINGKPFSVLELTERHRGYQGFSPPQANSLMQSTVAV
jgi:hypothetical protein